MKVFRCFAVVLSLVWGTGCQGSTVGETNPDGGNVGGASAAGGSGGGGTGGATGGTSGTGATGGAATGPGPTGALPSGYCCTADTDCRYRACLDFGGVRMCSDPCSASESCNTAPDMVCDSASGQCTPSGAPSCIPADQWVLGPNPTGGCCIATGDGHAGEECQGNLCVAFGDLQNPYICTQACDAPKDCPPKYQCQPGAGFCFPLADFYDCQ